METKSDIFSQRLYTAVIWNIGLQTSLAIGLVFLIQTDVLHPISWITSTIEEIFGLKMLLNIVLLVLVSFFQAYLYGSHCSTPAPKYFTRFSMFLDMFTLQNLLFSILYALSGYFTMSLYSSLAKSNYNVLKKDCERYDGRCLLEQSFFLQFGGLWMGLYYFLNSHVFGTPILLFPHIYQDKFQQIKLEIGKILSKGFKDSMAPILYYCVFYFVWGSRPRSVVCDVYSLYMEDEPLDQAVPMFRSGIWIGLWFYTSLFFISVYMMKTVFNIVLTEPMKFPIESERSLMLHTALAQRSHFNGYLGAQDLKIMALTDPGRREQVFTLSLPGGHPRNWNNILEACLNIINHYSKELESIYENKPNNEESKPLNKPPIYASNGHMRNLANSPQLMEMHDYNKNQVENTLSVALKNEFDKLLIKLCQKPGINYFFGELNDTKLKYLLIQAQPVLWTCEGLSFIVAASLNEDKYGIVQNDLPTVISALINLKHNLDKLTKLGLVPRKQILNDVFATKMKGALVSSVKRSIYKIVNTFAPYMKDIPLEHDVLIAIQPFLLCKEA